MKFSVVKRAITDFKALQKSSLALADVMLTLAECACLFTYSYGNMEESFYDAAYNNFREALKFMEKENIMDSFKLRADQCVNWASVCGYGFADDIGEVLYEYYKE